MLGMHLICLAFVCISDFIIRRMKYNWPTCVWKLFWIKCMIASGPRFPFTVFIFQFLTRVNLLCPPVFWRRGTVSPAQTGHALSTWGDQISSLMIRLKTNTLIFLSPQHVKCIPCHGLTLLELWLVLWLWL
jgi:hypothetical protein